MKHLFTTLFLMCACVSFSQDYHHWSEHFGARASLLGGAATAGLGDNATSYYNPAAMAFVENPSLSISVSAYRMRMLKAENALGKGLDLEENQFSTMPNLIAGVMAFDKHPKIRLGYSVLTRRSFNSNFDFLHESDQELIAGFAGPERFVYSYNLHHQLMEYWAGIGISYQVSEGFSIGLSHFGIYRDVKYSTAFGINVLPQDISALEIYELSSSQSFNYYNVKGVFKPSIALSVENFKFGISYTTPSFNMFGGGQAFREIKAINAYSIIPNAYLDIEIIDRVDGIKVRHKEFGSLAFGVSWRLGKKVWLHITNETYFGGKEYYIFDVDEKPSVYPDVWSEEQLEYEVLGGQNFLSLTEQTEARTNFGLGLEAKLAKRWDLYLGARTDFLYNEIPKEANNDVMFVSTSSWNLLHFSLGLVYLTKKNKRYTVGLEYGTATTNFNKYSQVNSHSFKLLLEIEVGRPPKNQ
ncbi:MAG: hypothetical protein QNK23_00850 [Crocinitomicaceae bacterium]|nr:hypothetical protein [Crocinitomicaceae bacterium]